MTQPVRLQLSRRKGFRLQALSSAVNGLPVANVARPSKWGNPWRVGLVQCGCRAAGECIHNQFRCETPSEAVDCFRHWFENWRNTKGLLGSIGDLRGKNLACWCPLDQPCHADALLELANRPICEAAEAT
jgi:hypothetical protein